MAQGKLDRAEDAAREQLTICTNLFSNDHADVAHALHTLARVLQKRDKLVNAEEAAQQAVAIFEKKTLNDGRPFTARVTLGEILLAQKRYPDAESWLHSGWQGLESRKSVLKVSEKERLKDALQGLEQICAETNRPNDAENWRRKLTEFERAK